MKMLNKLRIALAVTILALAAVASPVKAQRYTNEPQDPPTMTLQEALEITP
jgi:hypothetical protein